MLSHTDFMDIGRAHAGNPLVYLAIGKRRDGTKCLHAKSTMPEGPSDVGSYMAAWAAEWARIGFPTIQPTHTYAAALMATVPPADREISTPWPVFYHTVPDRLATLLNAQGNPEPVTGMLVYSAEERWTWVATAGHVEFSRVCYTLKEMCELRSSVDELPAWKRSDKLQPDDHDRRAAHCLSRLVVNACIAMADPTVVRAVGKAHQWKLGARLPETARIFELGGLVGGLDCRQNVRDYIAGTSKLRSFHWPVDLA